MRKQTITVTMDEFAEAAAHVTFADKREELLSNQPALLLLLLDFTADLGKALFPVEGGDDDAE